MIENPITESWKKEEGLSVSNPSKFFSQLKETLENGNPQSISQALNTLANLIPVSST